jgi:hypothetical protein
VQLPEVGWVMVTDVAVMGPPKVLDPDEDVEVGLPNPEMHDPTVTADTVLVTVWRKVVVGV